MFRMRVLAAASARCARSAPPVMLPASITWRNRLRSVRSKRTDGFPSDSAKQTYAQYLLSAKSPRVIFAIDESSSAERGALPRAATLVTNASAREDGEEQWPKSRHPLS